MAGCDERQAQVMSKIATGDPRNTGVKYDEGVVFVGLSVNSRH